MNRAVKIFIAIYLNNSSIGHAISDSDIEKAQITVGNEHKQFEELFEKNWRKYDLDIDDSSDLKSTYKRFVSPLPVYSLNASCNGLQLYWFDFSDFKVIDAKGESINAGAAYSGSGGTYGILFGSDFKRKQMKVFFDSNVISFGGLLKSTRSSNCPDILMVFSGNQFTASKYNGDYGYALVKYSKRLKKYLASKNKYPVSIKK